MTDKIILIGFMGSGKTTFGRYLSKKLSLKFIDTDNYIEEKTHNTINQIFSEQGEQVFRQMETDVLKELLNYDCGYVLSVGGGLPIKKENQQLLKKLGYVVYLDTSQEELFRRLSGDKNRPLLQGSDLKQKIHKLFNERKDIYENISDFSLKTDNMTLEGLYEELVKM